MPRAKHPTGYAPFWFDLFEAFLEGDRFVFTFSDRRTAIDKRNEYFSFRNALQRAGTIPPKGGRLVDPPVTMQRYARLFSQNAGWEARIEGEGPYYLIFQRKQQRDDISTMQEQLETQLTHIAVPTEPTPPGQSVEDTVRRLGFTSTIPTEDES